MKILPPAYDLAARIVLIVCIEGRIADEHLKDENAKGPPITFPLVACL